MSNFHLLGNWTDSIDPELHALKGFAALMLAASATKRYELGNRDMNDVAVLHSQLVKDLETRLKELDKESQELQQGKEVA